MAPSALVTGATGFVAHHLVGHLDRAGWETSALVRPDSSPARVKALPAATRVIVHDGTAEGLVRQLRGMRIDCAFHAASLFLAEHRPGDVESLVGSNVLFGTQLLEAMARNGASRLVNFGTSWQHYHSDGYLPVCLYAATKQALQDILLYYADAEGLRAITLILYDTYGPGDPRRKILSLLDRAAETGQALDMSPGGQMLDLVHVDDVARAAMMAADRLLSGRCAHVETFAVSSGRPISLRDLAALYEKAAGRRPLINWGGRPYRRREVMVPWQGGDPVPGWKPLVDLEEGLKRLYEGLSPATT